MLGSELDEEEIGAYKTQKSQKKLISYFKERIMIGPYSKGKILYSLKITASNAIDLIGSHELEKKIRKVAYYLRNVIHKTKKRPLPEDLKLEDVLRRRNRYTKAPTIFLLSSC